MKVKIKDIDAFKRCVFGADCFLSMFPVLTSEGIEVEKLDDGYYIPKHLGGNNTTFFTEEEIKSSMELEE